MSEYTIPLTENCIIAIHFDNERNSEHIIIGDKCNVSLCMAYGSSDIIFDDHLPIGSFITEYFKKDYDLIKSTSSVLCSNLAKKDTPQYKMCHDFLMNFYLSDNLCFRFLGVRLWQEYNKACGRYFSVRRKERIEVPCTLEQTIDELTLPFRCSVEDDLANIQKIHAKDVTSFTSREYFLRSCGLMWSTATGAPEYGFADESLIPLVLYILKRMHDAHKYYQKCRRCGKIFAANTASKPTFCSDTCKKAQARENKLRHTIKTRDDDVVKEYKNTYDYWYRKIKKLENSPTVNTDVLAQANEKHKSFRKEHKKRKKIDSSAELKTWIISQRDIIDELCSEHFD